MQVVDDLRHRLDRSMGASQDLRYGPQRYTARHEDRCLGFVGCMSQIIHRQILQQAVVDPIDGGFNQSRRQTYPELAGCCRANRRRAVMRSILYTCPSAMPRRRPLPRVVRGNDDTTAQKVDRRGWARESARRVNS